MSILGTITSFVSGIFKPAAELIDNIHTSDEEQGNIDIQKQELTNTLAQMKFQVQEKFMEYEVKLLDLRHSIVQSEIKDGNILTKSWRPALMVIFAFLIVAKWLGFSAEGISPELELELFRIVKLGLTGYIAGRSGEKIVKEFKKKK